MTRQISVSKFAAMAAALGGIIATQTAAVASADETAVRQTLAKVEQLINRGDMTFVDVFAKDAVIVAPSAPDVVGFDAIRAMYTDLMQKAKLTVHFSTAEVVTAGDLAYERGTYTLRITDKSSGKILQDVDAFIGSQALENAGLDLGEIDHRFTLGIL